MVEAYLLALVALLLVGGSLGDKFGRKLMFVSGLVGFGVTSVLCAIAPTTEVLIGARALQGIAGALLVPGSLALVASAFEGEERGRAVGTWTAWTGIATVLGPAGGGFLVDQLDWRWIFWINVPLVAATVLLTLRHVDESKDPEAVPGIDWVGIALSALGLGGPVFALIEQPTYGWSDPIVFVPLDRRDRALRALHRLGAPRRAPDARAEPVQGPQLRRREHGHARRLRRAHGRLLLHHPFPPADRGLHGARGWVGDTADVARAVLPLAPLRQDRLGDRAAAADDASARSSAASAC